MGRPKFVPDVQTMRWVLRRAAQAAKDLRRDADHDGKRGRYHEAMLHEASAFAIMTFAEELRAADIACRKASGLPIFMDTEPELPAAAEPAP